MRSVSGRKTTGGALAHRSRLHSRIGLSRFNAICAIGRLRLLVIRNTLRGKRFNPPAFKHLINFIIRRRISLAGYTGEASVSYHGRADRPDGCAAVTPSALTRICYTPAKKIMNSSGRSPGLLFRCSLMNSSIRIGTKPIAQLPSLTSR